MWRYLYDGFGTERVWAAVLIAGGCWVAGGASARRCRKAPNLRSFLPPMSACGAKTLTAACRNADGRQVHSSALGRVNRCVWRIISKQLWEHCSAPANAVAADVRRARRPRAPLPAARCLQPGDLRYGGQGRLRPWLATARAAQVVMATRVGQAGYGQGGSRPATGARVVPGGYWPGWLRRTATGRRISGRLTAARLPLMLVAIRRCAARRGPRNPTRPTPPDPPPLPRAGSVDRFSWPSPIAAL
jgi:hypothetical protein